MRRGLALASLFFAWLCANGAIWDVVQLVAWTRMFTGYAEALPLGAALRETFDASKPCELCQVVTHARETQPSPQSPPLEAGTAKLLLACEAPPAIFLSRPPPAWPAVRWAMQDSRVEPVPLPPPRV